MSEVITNWVLFDATADKQYIKKMMPEGVLAFFDSEEDAKRAKASNKGTDYKRIDRVKASDYDQLKADSEVMADLVESRLAENLRLKLANEFVTRVADDLLAENKVLRDQLDEARGLLAGTMQYISAEELDHFEARIDAWLEANK